MPYYISIGLSHKTFFHSTPKILKAYDEGHRLKLKEADLLNWYAGQYFGEAIMSTIGNSSLFKAKGHKAHEYPKEPFTMTIEREKHEQNLSDEEKKRRTEALFRNLEIMAFNFEQTKNQAQ